MIHPILSPSLSSTSLGTSNSAHNVTKPLSMSSTHSISGLINASSSSSSLGSIQFAPGEVEVVKEEGLRHAMVTLEARWVALSTFVYASSGYTRFGSSTVGFFLLMSYIYSCSFFI